MPGWLKFTIGLAAALLTGWISHGPLGQGEAFVGLMEAQAKAVVREAAVPGVATVRWDDPESDCCARRE